MKRRTSVLIWSSLVALVVLAAYLRLHSISTKSLWADEAVTAAFTRLGWYDLARILWRREGNMTLYYLLLRGWSVLGDSEAVLRGFSALWSVATVPAIFAIGRRLFSPVTGIVAALLWSVNAYSVRYAQEARSYSMVACLVTLATYFLVRAIQSNAAGEQSTSSWKWYIVVSTLAVYAHFFAILAVIAHIVAFWRRPEKPRVVSALKWILLFTLPVWIFVATTGAGPLRWVPRPTLSELWLSLGHYSGNAGWPLVLLYLAGVVIAISLRRGDRNLWLLGSWFFVPILIALLFSLARPVFVPRYFIICIPALVLAVAAGFTALRPSWLAVPLLAATCWLGVSGVRSYYRIDFDNIREDFRSVSAYVINNSQPGDVIVFHRVFNRFGFSYYADRNAASIKPTIIYPGSEKPVWRDFIARVTPETIQAIRTHKQRVWLLASENAGPQPEDEVIQQLKAIMANTHHLAGTRDFTSLRIYLYE
jgi:mannosyltransferase